MPVIREERVECDLRINGKPVLESLADLIIRDPTQMERLQHDHTLSPDGFERLKDVIARKLADRRKAGAARASFVAEAKVAPEQPSPVDPYEDQCPSFVYAYCGRRTCASFEALFYEFVDDRLERQRKKGASNINAKVSRVQICWLLVRVMVAGSWESLTDYFSAARRWMF